MFATYTSPTAGACRLPTSSLSSARGPVVMAADGDDLAAVVRAGVLLTRQLDRDPIVLSALDPLHEHGWHSPEMGEDGTARVLTQRRHEHVQRELLQGGGSSKWPVAIVLGSAARTLARVTREAGASVLVMGIGRPRPADRLLGAETVLRTSRLASCPVLAVPRDFTRLPGVAVVGVDFSRGSTDALRAVLPFLHADAVVHLVHVCHTVELADSKAVARDERYRAQLPARFRTISAHVGVPDGLEVMHDVREGRPAEQLLAAADALHADMIVIGRHGDGWLDRLMVGRVAERVLRGATCAVLVVPEVAPSAAPPVPMLDGIAGVRHPREVWAEVLDRFTRDNAGHITVLEMCDGGEGPCSREAGYALFGMTYRVDDHEVEILLGESNGRRRHLTRIVPDPRALVSFADERGDRAVQIEHGSGQLLLTLTR